MQTIFRHFEQLQKLVRERVTNFFSKNETAGFSVANHLAEPSLFTNAELSPEEHCILLLALAPHIQPGMLDTIIQELLPQGGEFPEFGGVKSGSHRGTIPTGETALFLLAADDWDKRRLIYEIFSQNHFFYKEKILWLEEVKESEPRMSGRLILSPEWLEWWITGKTAEPRFTADFPAKRVHTKMNWEDAVLHPQTLKQINIIASWLAHNNHIQKDINLSAKLKPGYRVLFYGPSGTGKTLTASLIGKQFNKDVYKIDLSQVISKYIGETEQNLEKIFRKAENKEWILFFDEADALFGKRTGVQSSNDRYANQEVSYLLQRVEDFPGLIILASNLKNNIDKAFLRRFHQLIHFPQPNADDRYSIWQNSLPKSISLDDNIDLRRIAQDHEITGASILNIIQHAVLNSLQNGGIKISLADVNEGIRIELQKDE